MNDRRYKLIYHSLHGRPLRGGCMPVFLFFTLLLLGGVLMMVRVEMPKPLQAAGEGNIYYRKDALLFSQIRQRSPLPMMLPDFVDPARQQEEHINLPLRRELQLLPAPAESPFASAPDSVVLNPISLLELPPTAQEQAAVDAAANRAIERALPTLANPMLPVAAPTPSLEPAPISPATPTGKEAP